MDRARLTIKFNGLIHLQCEDGYMTGSGIENERLFLRSSGLNDVGDEALPFFDFSNSVFQLVPTLRSVEDAAQGKAAAKGNDDDGAEGDDIVDQPELTYGQPFSLIHSASGLYVSLSKSQRSANDRDCMSVVLVDTKSASSASCEFILVSRYKIRSEGDKLCRADEVLIRLASKPIFLHVSEPPVMQRAIEENESEYELLCKSYRYAGNLSFATNVAGGSAGKHGDNKGGAAPGASFALQGSGVPVADPSEASKPVLEALAREYLDEVNGCEEGGVTFVLDRYDIGTDRANTQRNQLHITHPYVSCGTPIALYHRERESFLTSSVTNPRHVPAGDSGSENKTSLPLRQRQNASQGVQTHSGAEGQVHGSTGAYEDAGVANKDGGASQATSTSQQRKAMRVQLAKTVKGMMDGGKGVRTPFPVFAATRAATDTSEREMSMADKGTNITSLWMIQQENPSSGGPVRLGGMQYRIQHLLTGQYLAVCGSAVDELFLDAEDIDDSASQASARDATPGNQSLIPGSFEPTRETALCLIDQPHSEKDLRRSLFTMESMYATECQWLIEQDCLLIKNTITGMYVCTQSAIEGANIRLSLQWQPSVSDTIVASYVSDTVQTDAQFVAEQCKHLVRFRELMQALMKDKLAERAALKEAAAKGDQAAIAAIKAREEAMAQLPAKVEENLKKPDQDATLLHAKHDPDAKLPPMHPDFQVLSHPIQLAQRAVSQLIRFCVPARPELVLSSDLLNNNAAQKMLFDAGLYRLLFDVILAPFTPLCGDPTQAPEDADAPPRGRNHLSMMLASLHNEPVSMYSLWDINETSNRIPALPLKEGCLDFHEIMLEEHSELHLLVRLVYRLLRQMVLRRADLAVGWTDYVPLMIAMDGRVLRCVDTMQAMFTDNRAVPLDTLKLICHRFVTAERTIRRGPYIDLIGLASTLKFTGFPDRQEYVCQKLLIENPGFLMKLDVQDGVVYVTPDVKDGSRYPLNEFLMDPKNANATGYIIDQVALMLRMCYDGCPPLCREVVSKLFTYEAMLITLRTLVWTGSERVGVPSHLDNLRSHLVRLALQVHAIDKISDPAIQLRVSTVLYGASTLRKVDSNYYSGVPDDEMTLAIKRATLNLLRANPYFVQEDVPRSTLLRSCVSIWMRLMRQRQCTAQEVEELVPVLLGLLNGRNDVMSLRPGGSKNIDRFERQVESVQLMRVREMICAALQAALESAVLRGADEVIRYLYRALTDPDFNGEKPWLADNGNGGKGRLFALESSCFGLRKKKKRADGYEEIGGAEDADADGKDSDATKIAVDGTVENVAGGDSDDDDDVSSEEEEDMDDDAVLRAFGAIVASNSRDASAMSGKARTALSSKDVHDYLNFLTANIVSLFQPQGLVPVLMDTTRYNNDALTVQSMRLMVQLCIVKRSMAHLVLEVNTLPPTEVVRSFDSIYDVAVELQRSMITDRKYGPSWETAIQSVIATLMGSFEAQLAGQEPQIKPVTEMSMSGSGGLGSGSESGSPLLPPQATAVPRHSLAEFYTAPTTKESSKRPHAQSTSLKERVNYLWSKVAAACRMMTFSNTLRRRRAALGLSDSSSVPQHLVIRAELMAHWGIHRTLLKVLPKVPADSDTYFSLMRFFYYFSLSENNAKTLRGDLDVFMTSLKSNTRTRALVLNIVICIFGTMSDIDDYLVPELLDVFVQRLEQDINTVIPDREFAELLSEKVFGKPSVSIMPRRRMMLALRDRDALRRLSRPRPNPSLAEIKFTSALVNLVCNVCGSAASVLSLAQEMLPASRLSKLVERVTQDDILDAAKLNNPMAIEPTDRVGSFKMVNPYLRALVALYFTNVEDNMDERHRMQMTWTEDKRLWKIIGIIRDLQTRCADLCKNKHAGGGGGGARDDGVVNAGVQGILNFRLFFLTTVPVTLCAIFQNCFSQSAFYRVHDGPIGQICAGVVRSAADFGEQLLQYKGSLQLTVEEVVQYRRMLGVIQYRATKLNLPDLEGPARKCGVVKNELRAWLSEKQELLQEEVLKVEKNRQDLGLIDVNDDDVGAFDVLFGEDAASSSLMDAGGVGLSMSSALASSGGGIALVRATLRNMLKGNTLIPPGRQISVARVVNAMLVKTPDNEDLLKAVTCVVGAMNRHLFAPRTFVGLMNLFYNSLDTALNHPERVKSPQDDADVGDAVVNIGEDLMARQDQNEDAGELGYRLQCAFNKAQMATVAVSLCAIEDDVVSYSAIRLGIALLEGGNPVVQASLLNYFLTREEAFFHNARVMLLSSLQWTQRMNSEHQYYLLKRGMRGNERSISSPSANMQLVEALKPVTNVLKIRANRSALAGWARVRGARRLRLMTALLRLIQLFCEGHNLPLQDYIRNQSDNLHSVNMVVEVMNFMHEMTCFVTPVNMGVITQGYELLTEICQGPCHGNQETLLSTNVCGCCRTTAQFVSESVNAAPDARDTLNELNKANVSGLRLSISNVVLALLEGCREKEVFSRILVGIPISLVESEMTCVRPHMYYAITHFDRYEEDPSVETLFNWLIFLRTVAPYASESEKEHIETIMTQSAVLQPFLGQMEISREDGLEPVYFRIPQICMSLTQENKDSLLWSVDRSSRTSKLSDFVHKADDLIFAIERNHDFQLRVARWTRFDVLYDPDASVMARTWQRCRITFNNYVAPYVLSYDIGYYELISMVLAVFVNLVLVLVEGGQLTNPLFLQLESTLVFIACIVQALVSFVAFYIDTTVNFPVHLYTVYKEKQRNLSGVSKFDMTMSEVYEGLTRWEVIWEYCTWFQSVFRICLLIFAMLSCYTPYFAAFNLMLMVYKVPTLRNFIGAIFMNGKQLLLSTLLGLILLYLFSIIGYLFFRSEYDPDSEEPDLSNPNCDTLLHCFTYIFSQGLRQGGGVSDVMRPWGWEDGDMVSRITYDMLFYALVTVVFLNILFGIIIDTFGEMRDNRREVEDDMHGNCYICGMDSDALEKLSVNGFLKHVKNDHNMWMYLYFMHHLRRKDPNDFNGQESYVGDCISAGTLNFFPDENCLALEAKRAAGEADDDDDDDEEAHRQAVLDLAAKLDASKDQMAAQTKELHANSAMLKSLLQQMELAQRAAESDAAPGISGSVPHGQTSGTRSLGAGTRAFNAGPAPSERSVGTRAPREVVVPPSDSAALEKKLKAASDAQRDIQSRLADRERQLEEAEAARRQAEQEAAAVRAQLAAAQRKIEDEAAAAAAREQAEADATAAAAAASPPETTSQSRSLPPQPPAGGGEEDPDEL